MAAVHPDREDTVAMEPPPPEVLALVLADHIHHDDETGKLFILGTRLQIWARSFPLDHPALAVYAALVDGRGNITLRFRLVDSDEEGEVVAEEEAEVTFDDPLTELQVVVSFNELVFPEPGEYRLQLFAGGQFLRERRLMVGQIENPSEPDGP
jgi:hypothetical protein